MSVDVKIVKNFEMKINLVTWLIKQKIDGEMCMSFIITFYEKKVAKDFDEEKTKSFDKLTTKDICKNLIVDIIENESEGVIDLSFLA